VRVLLNLIWLVFGGLLLAFGSAVVALVMFILIITIPFGVASFRLAGYALWPFGRTVVKKPTAGAGSVIGNIIWLPLAGWWLALAHLITAALLAITIIGLPLAYANVKLIPVALWPFGREIVSASEVSAAFAGYQGRAGAPIPPPVQLPTGDSSTERRAHPS
jgi:uncharacterized membrane protein YccF (DUF307 family)